MLPLGYFEVFSLELIGHRFQEVLPDRWATFSRTEVNQLFVISISKFLCASRPSVTFSQLGSA